MQRWLHSGQRCHGRPLVKDATQRGRRCTSTVNDNAGRDNHFFTFLPLFFYFSFFYKFSSLFSFFSLFFSLFSFFVFSKKKKSLFSFYSLFFTFRRQYASWANPAQANPSWATPPWANSPKRRGPWALETSVKKMLMTLWKVKYD